MSERITTDIIDGGDIGVAKTVGKIRASARDASTMLPVRKLLRLAMADSLPMIHGAGTVARAVYDLVRARMTFQSDGDAELIRHPANLADDILSKGRAFGDCDDSTALCCALLLAGGQEPAVVTAGEYANGPFVHVHPALILVGGGVLPFDPQEGYYGSKDPREKRTRVWRFTQ